MRISLVVVAALLLVNSVVSQNWSYCSGSSGSKINVSAFTASPWPIVKGKSAKFETKGTANINISQRNARMDVYTGGSKIFTTSVGNSYSVGSGGAYDYIFSYTIPSFVPPGAYTITITMVDNSGNDMVCMSVNQSF